MLVVLAIGRPSVGRIERGWGGIAPKAKSISNFKQPGRSNRVREAP